MPELDLDSLVLMKVKCPECEGTTWIEVPTPYCTFCNRSFSEKEQYTIYLSRDDYLPCGHDRDYLRAGRYNCPDCEATGWVQREVPLREIARVLGLLMEGEQS